MSQFYNVAETPSLIGLLDEIDARQAEINAQKPLHQEIWATIQEKLRIEWTYDSNALEGSALTKGETYFFLREGLTVEGKPFKDFLDARNHAEAIDYLYQIDDGNGRGARILMNLILIKKQYAPAVIKKEQRRTYLETLGLADAGDLAPFAELVARGLLNTQQIIVQDLKAHAN